MKILVCSDIHGNDENFKKVIDFYLSESLDKMIILGDIFSSMFFQSVKDSEISSLLYKIAPQLVTVRGNRDSSINQKHIPTCFVDKHTELIGDKTAVFYHGHKNVYESYDMYFSGHTHYVNLEKTATKICCNPGSVGRPRDYTNGSFMVLSEHTITIFDMDYKVISELTY